MVASTVAGRRRALTALKTVHTMIWALVEAAMAYLIVSGLRGSTDRKTVVAAGLVAAESAVFLANGARCPLTSMAESLGAESGSVTDLYLPQWLAHYLPVIHVPLIGLAVYLHVRNLRRQSPAPADRLVR